MNKSEIHVSNKHDIIEYLKKLPDDAIIIEPAWSLHGQIKCPTKKSPNPSIDVRLFLAEDLIVDTGITINNLRKLNFIPLFWIAGEPAKSALTEKTLELAKGNGNPPDYGLTAQELKVLFLITEGLLDKQVAHKLKISFQNVKNYGVSIREKLGTRTRTETAVKAIKEGII